MAVVVQRMVFPQAAGILFTAHPVTGDRKIASVEASFGLGEALVSGRVDPDIYTVRDDEIIAKAVGTKKLAVIALPAGGTQEQPIEAERQDEPALTDAQVVQLVQLGRRIEAHFGLPPLRLRRAARPTSRSAPGRRPRPAPAPLPTGRRAKAPPRCAAPRSWAPRTRRPA